jgi:hypothetical protein
VPAYWWAKKKRNEEPCGKDCAVVSPASVVAEWPQNDWPEQWKELLGAILVIGIVNVPSRQAGGVAAASSVLGTPRWPLNCPATVPLVTLDCSPTLPYCSPGIR